LFLGAVKGIYWLVCKIILLMARYPVKALGFAVVVSAVFVALLALWRTLVIFGVPALWSVSLGEREAPALTLALAGLAMLPLGLALGDRVRRAHRPVRPEEVDVDVETPFDDDVDEGPESPPPRA
ncbi:MAG TPA: hypothetical protein RMH26_21900, partial [Polyangiaceae bacterium LLY-WYZ-15_(1-7)]|nr:hypothetical protein [Polyangiaceae bacterium LLY-WYZ-15_(1-7)]